MGLEKVAHVFEAGVQAGRGGAEPHCVNLISPCSSATSTASGSGPGRLEVVEQVDRGLPPHRFAFDALDGQEIVSMLIERLASSGARCRGKSATVTRNALLARADGASSAARPLSCSKRKHRAISARTNLWPKVAVSRPLILIITINNNKICKGPVQAAVIQPGPRWQRQAVAFFFTLMHSCGLRTGETRALQTGQVDLDAGHIDIIWSKGNRSRRLPLTDQVIEISDTCDRTRERSSPHVKRFSSPLPATRSARQQSGRYSAASGTRPGCLGRWPVNSHDPTISGITSPTPTSNAG